jgi:hypothetical protein
MGSSSRTRQKTFEFHKRRGIFDQLSDHQLLKEDFTPRGS